VIVPSLAETAIEELSSLGSQKSSSLTSAAQLVVQGHCVLLWLGYRTPKSCVGRPFRGIGVAAEGLRKGRRKVDSRLVGIRRKTQQIG
jgi:hypothetical protein